MNSYDVVLANLRRLRPGYAPARIVPVRTPLSQPLDHSGTCVRLLRDFPGARAGEVVLIHSNHIGGLRLVKSRRVIADDSCPGAALAEGTDFEFVRDHNT